MSTEEEEFKMFKQWQYLGMVLVIVAASVFASYVVRAIWFSPDQEYYDCVNYTHSSDVVVCKHRDVL